MAARRELSFFCTLACLAVVSVISFEPVGVTCDQIQLSAILPKLEAIHEDAKSLLIKNSELKAKILVGLQAQNNAKIQSATGQNPQPVVVTQPEAIAAPGVGPVPPSPTKPMARPATEENGSVIDYSELEEFNKWVDTNLEYAVKNTRASIETFREEAQQNNGNVDYSEQAIQDGIEGVKYWQSAVIFQDKTLKNEKFDSD